MFSQLVAFLVGFGAVAEGFATDTWMDQHFETLCHAEVLRDQPAPDWQAVVNASDIACDRAKNIWYAPQVFDKFDEALEQIKPNGAVIAFLPEGRLKTITRFKTTRGFILEKPIVASFREAVAILELTKRRGQAFQVNYWYPADENFTKFFGPVLRSSLGALHPAAAIYRNNLHNNGSHLVDLIRLFAGDISAERACGEGSPSGPIIGNQNIPFLLKLQGGATIYCATVDFRHCRGFSIDLLGTIGRLAFFNESLSIQHFPVTQNRGLDSTFKVATDQPETMQPRRCMAFRIMYDDLCDAISTSSHLISPLHDRIKIEYVSNSIIKAHDHQKALGKD